MSSTEDSGTSPCREELQRMKAPVALRSPDVCAAAFPSAIGGPVVTAAAIFLALLPRGGEPRKQFSDRSGNLQGMSGLAFRQLSDPSDLRLLSKLISSPAP